MLLLIDNYDSFTYNLFQYLSELGARVVVVRNNKVTLDEIDTMKPDQIVISPGPSTPLKAGISNEVISYFGSKIPILGICLGHQILGLAYGGKTYKLKFGHRGGNQPVKDLQTGRIEITSQNHGFCVDPESLDQEKVEITHVNLSDGSLEGMRHREYPAFSVQHHPEDAPGPHDASYLFGRFVEMMK